MKPHFEMFAAYNQWANSLLYQAAAELTDAEYRHNVGLFFGSLHETLNHVLVGDRIWMQRMTSEGVAPEDLDTILFEDFEALRPARETEDRRIISHIDQLTERALAGDLEYRNVAGKSFKQPRAQVLAHFSITKPTIGGKLTPP